MKPSRRSFKIDVKAIRSYMDAWVSRCWSYKKLKLYEAETIRSSNYMKLHGMDWSYSSTRSTKYWCGFYLKLLQGISIFRSPSRLCLEVWRDSVGFNILLALEAFTFDERLIEALSEELERSWRFLSYWRRFCIYLYN